MDAPDWDIEGAAWPNRATSRFVEAAGLRWHVQIAGAGPVMLLVHGTGAATHSWAGVLPRLAAGFQVVAPDLPGHGFTSAPAAARMSLPGMAESLLALLRVLGVTPTFVAGHSAGAAILMRLCLDKAIAPQLLFSLNGALLPLPAQPMRLLAPVARVLVANPLVPRLFAWQAADRRVVDRLLQNTGSQVPADTREIYGRLARRAGHAGAALTMMSHWDLAPLRAEMSRLAVPLVMINGGNDRLIPPSEGRRVRDLVPGARLILLPGLGHLAHEEAADQVAGIMIEQADAA
jgi:magnesium chelatase accessory protein